MSIQYRIRVSPRWGRGIVTAATSGYGRVRQMETSSRSSVAPTPRHAIVVVVVVVGLFLLPIAGHPPATNPNELVRIELALAMATWATIDLDSPARIYGLSEDVARHNGRLRADKAPGLSIAAVPVVWLSRFLLPSIPGADHPQYWPLRHLLTAVLVALGTAFLCFFVAAGIPDLRTEDQLPLALITALSTPLWAYGTVFFGHAPAAVLIAVAWILLLQHDAAPGTSRAAFLGGLSAGAAIATEYPTVLLVAIVFVSMLFRRVPKQPFVTALAGLAVGLLPALVYHQFAFGAPWLTGYAFKADPGFQQIHTTGLSGVSLPSIEGLWGVLFSSARGLFFYSPVLLFAPIGLWLMHRRRGWRDAAPLTAAVVVYVAFAAGFVDWQAGWCAAARHLVPVIPLFVIPTVVAMAAMVRSRPGLFVLAGVVALSATRSFLTVVVTPFFPPEFANPLAQIVLPSLREGAAAPNLVSSTVGLPAGFVWLAAAALAAALLVWALAALKPGTTTWIAIIVALVITSQVAWWVWRSPPPDPRLENYRAQLLTGLGHIDVAARIESDLRSGAPAD